MRLHRGGGTNRDSDRIGGETGRRAIALVSIRTRRAVARRRRSPQYLPTRAGNARALRRRPPQRRLAEIAVGMDFSWLILLRIIDCEPHGQHDPGAGDVANPSKRFLRTLYFRSCALSMLMETPAAATIPYEHLSPRLCRNFFRS